ncbi:hypothetical protein ACROYT_G002817 [Oculina patagonica]
MAEGGNYSFFNHNPRTTAMQQSFDRPKLLQQRQSQSPENRLDSSSSKAVGSKKDAPLLVREGETQNVKFVPHPPSSPRSNSAGTLEGNPRVAALNSKGVKRTRYESPRTSPSGSEDERRSRKHVVNVMLDPLPLKRSGSTGSLDSIGSSESLGSPRDKNKSVNRNLRGIEPLKGIGSDKELINSFKSYQNSAKSDDLGKRILKKNIVHPLRVEQEQIESNEDISTQTESTPIKSNCEKSTVLYDEPPAEDEVTLSSSNDSLTSVSDSEENSISNSDTDTKDKNMAIRRDPNSTLPTLPGQLNDRTLGANESGLYDTVHPSEINQDDLQSVPPGQLNDQSVVRNASGLYESIHPNEHIYQNEGNQDDLQHNSTTDLRQLSKALAKVATDDERYASDTDMSFRSTGQVSNYSVASTLLPRVSARRARTRSGNFLKEEMERYFPDRQIGVFVATWNMHEEKEVPFYLEDFLIPDSTDFLQDLYVIGLQEATSQKKEWEVRLQETLGPSHVLMYSCSFGLLHLAVFIRRELVWFCSAVSEDSVSTRVGHMIKTKGALAVSFSIFGTSFLFIDSHFTSDEGKAMDRVNDYKTICKSLSLSPENQPNRNNELDLTANFDRVFWLGDFNFRVSLDRSKVDGMLEKYKDQENPECKDLLEKDQLLDLMEQEKVFVGFTEPPIKFLPSYKHDIQSDNYDSSSKNRTPSWTDRVLYRSRDPSSIQPVMYSSCVSVKTSDHRPVFGIYQVKLNPCRENIPLTGGQYIRDVYIEANRRRAVGPKSQDQSSVCVIL